MSICDQIICDIVIFTPEDMGTSASVPGFQRRPRTEVKEHMERLQNISDTKPKPILKDGGVLELSVR